MRDKFNKFMQGRYGVDDLSRFTMGVALVLIILAMFANIFSRTVGSTDLVGWFVKTGISWLRLCRNCYT